MALCVTLNRCFVLEVTFAVLSQLFQPAVLTPVVCPKACLCGSIFGEKPYVRCSNVEQENLYKVLSEIPESTENIKMMNTSLKEVYEFRGNFPKLHDLSLQNCSIHDLNEALRPFLENSKRKIYSISVNYHDITTVKGSGVQSLATLQKLDLCHNNIHSIDKSAFTNCSNLRILKLCFNKLEILNENIFMTNTDLTSLYLENNNFKEIPMLSLVNLKNLQLLDLSNNDLRSVPSLEDLSTLKYLYLSNNRITTVQTNAFNELQHLSVLWLSGNLITSLPEDMSLLFHLMDFNRIVLKENSLGCSCQNRWMIAWFQKKCSKQNKSVGCALTCIQSGSNFLVKDFDMKGLRCGCTSQCFCLNQDNQQCSVDCYNETEGSNRIQTLKCSSCPSGSSPLFDGSSNCVCQSGHSLRDGLCKRCPKGTFKPLIGPMTCTPCPEYSTSMDGSTSPEHCICQHGEFQIMSDQERKCQRYENEELVRLGFSPIVSSGKKLSVGKPSIIGIQSTVTFTPVEKDQGTLYGETSQKSDSVIYGVVGTAVTLLIFGVVFAFFKFKQTHKTNYGISQKLMCQDSYQNEERHGSLVYSTKLENYYKGLEVASSQLKIGKLIGRGAFGRVYEGHLHNTKDRDTKRVAVKRLKEDANGEEKEALQMELDHMMYVGKHPNIIELIGVCSIKGTLMLVLEFASNGDLLSYLRQCSSLTNLQLTAPRFGNDKTAVEIFRTLIMFAWQVAKGMCHLEKLKCIHRDLAARNVLLTSDPIAKISDFGLSRDVYESAYYFKVSKGRLPFKWMSPEALLMGQYSIKSDVWSFGILLWEVVTLGGNPYAGIPVESLCEMYSNNYRLPKPGSCPGYLYRLMLDCWGELTNDRPSFNDIEARLDTVLQHVADRDYTNLMDKEEVQASVSSTDGVTDSKGYMTMSSVYDTDSDDRTFHETSESDSSKDIDLKPEPPTHRPYRIHQSIANTAPQQGRVSCGLVTSEQDKNSSYPLMKSMSLIELQNLSDYKVQMWSNPIYGSTRKVKETYYT